jgi:hypothetical protein
LRRQEALKSHISEYQYHATKEIWDIDYMTTSDEEDNESDYEDESKASSLSLKKP